MAFTVFRNLAGALSLVPGDIFQKTPSAQICFDPFLLVPPNSNNNVVRSNNNSSNIIGTMSPAMSDISIAMASNAYDLQKAACYLKHYIKIFVEIQNAHELISNMISNCP